LPVSERGERLAAGLLSRVDEVQTTIEPLDDATWARICVAEGWPIGMVAYHLGLGFRRQGGWLAQHAKGGRPHDFSWDETHALNAAFAARSGLPTKDQTRRFLDKTSRHFASIVRALSDEQLDATAYVYKEKPRSADWVVAVLAYVHIDGHLASIRATLGSSA